MTLPSAAAALPPNTIENILSPRDSSYIVEKADLRAFLERKYQRTDFEISVGHRIARVGSNNWTDSMVTLRQRTADGYSWRRKKSPRRISGGCLRPRLYTVLRMVFRLLLEASL